MTTQAFPRRVVVTASLLSCAPRPGSPEAPAFAALLADEADYLLRRYGTAQRGLTDEAAEERDYLAAAAQDLQALADLYRAARRPTATTRGRRRRQVSVLDSRSPAIC